MQGINIQILLGKKKAETKAPRAIIESIRSIQITKSDEGRDGFQISLALGRNSLSSLLKGGQLANADLLKPSCRVILIVFFNTSRKVLLDGIITHHQYSPSRTAGESTLTITGEDVSIILDKEERHTTHKGSINSVINNILNSGDYSNYGFSPLIADVPDADKGERKQIESDLKFILKYAQDYNCIFYVEPADTLGKNLVYWGPANRKTLGNKDLLFDMGSFTNILSINFQYNSLKPELVVGTIKDKDNDKVEEIVITDSTLSSLVSNKSPLAFADKKDFKTRWLKLDKPMTTAEAYTRAQDETDKSFEEIVTASGELDSLQYGDIIKPRSLVNLKGVAPEYQGKYYVKSVTHNFKRGEYKQSFNLTREGLDSAISFN